MTTEEHRQGLIKLYTSQLHDGNEESKFMTIVLTEAIRKLKETKLSPSKIEKWVVKLEKAWRIKY